MLVITIAVIVAVIGYSAALGAIAYYAGRDNGRELARAQLYQAMLGEREHHRQQRGPRHAAARPRAATGPTSPSAVAVPQAVSRPDDHSPAPPRFRASDTGEMRRITDEFIAGLQARAAAEREEFTYG